MLEENKGTDFEIEKISDISQKKGFCSFKLRRLGAPKDIRIDVVKTKAGFYCAECNYAFWGKTQSDPYVSSRASNGDTPEKALNVELQKINIVKSYSSPSDYCWKSHERSDYYVMGTGEIISYSDFQKKRNLS